MLVKYFIIKTILNKNKECFSIGIRNKIVYIELFYVKKIKNWIQESYIKTMNITYFRLILVIPKKFNQIIKYVTKYMGCLSSSFFRNLSQNELGITEKRIGILYIQKTLQDIAHKGVLGNNLMSSSHNAYRFFENFFIIKFILIVKHFIQKN